MEIIFKSPFFGYGCVIAAFLLYWTSKKEYKLCLRVVAYEFLLCAIASIIGLELTRIWAKWEIYAVYGLIQLTAVLALFIYQYKKHPVSLMLALLIGFAGLINIEFALSWTNQGFTSYTAKYIHSIYTNLFAYIMLGQLFFMLICNKSILERIFKNGGIKNNIIDRVFFVYPRAYAGGSGKGVL